ncbi:MAG: hypothetical protein EA428_04840 [Spirochaetaceae bacterium]|nr:MAG: hypothetical protein EA428_04840 [Spirochaetaceae bacterium]
MRISKLTMVAAVFMMVGSMAAFATPAFQSTDSDTLTIGGNVPARVDISIAGVDAEGLDLQSVVTNRLIAEVTERSNVRAGYTVSVESANGFKLRGTYTDVDQDELAYALTYDDESVDTANGSFTFAKRAARTGSGLGHSGDTRELKISYDALNVNLFDGDYEDTLTFTITAEE